jgi:hypothetical protein
MRRARGLPRVFRSREITFLYRSICRDGNSALPPITWIGHRRIECRRHPKPGNVWPVRVQAGAFGQGRPVGDLSLPPDHAAFVEDVLIAIKHLVNGTSVAQVETATVTYFHIELAPTSPMRVKPCPCIPTLPAISGTQWPAHRSRSSGPKSRP